MHARQITVKLLEDDLDSARDVFNDHDPNLESLASIARIHGFLPGLDYCYRVVEFGRYDAHITVGRKFGADSPIDANVDADIEKVRFEVDTSEFSLEYSVLKRDLEALIQNTLEVARLLPLDASACVGYEALVSRLIPLFGEPEFEGAPDPDNYDENGDEVYADDDE